MVKVAAYGIPWIPKSLVETYIKSKWELLDYTRKQLSFEEVKNSNPEVIISFSPPMDLLKHHSIKYIISPGAGIDGLPLEEIRKREIKLINSHSNSSTVAEQAWALLLSAAKKIPKYDSIVRSQALWPDRGSQIKDVNVDLENKTIGIVGYGPIGKKIEKFARGFLMEPVIFRMNPSEYQFQYSDLLNEAENLDFLILACPLTAETKGIISKEIIEILPAHTIVVNIARGALVDEEAVFDALREGKLHTYSSDVWINSPYGMSKVGTKPNQLVEVPNLIISPHRAWISNESHLKTAKQIAEELDKIDLGIRSTNQVTIS